MDDDFEELFTNDIDINTQEFQSASISTNTQRKRNIQHLNNRKY